MAFAVAIATRALVPVAIIVDAQGVNTFTRNAYKERTNKGATVQQEAKVSKIAS